MKMSRFSGLLKSLLVVVPLLLAAHMLTAQDVKSNAMPSADFSKYHTYKWVQVAGASQPNQIVDAEIKQAVDAQLSAKGLTKATGDKADLYVGYQTAVSQQQQWNAYGEGGRWGGGMASATSSTINIGTLVVDMYDPATKQLVWTGQATKTMDPSNNQQKNEKNLDKAMAKLFKNFPPGA